MRAFTDADSLLYGERDVTGWRVPGNGALPPWAVHCDECWSFATRELPYHQHVWHDDLPECQCEWPVGYKCLGYRWAMPHSYQ